MIDRITLYFIGNSLKLADAKHVAVCENGHVMGASIDEPIGEKTQALICTHCDKRVLITWMPNPLSGE